MNRTTQLNAVWATIWIIIESGLFVASLFVGMRLFPVRTPH